MSIPHCFDNLLGAKPKHPRVGELSATPLPVEEVAPPSQIPGLNLTQFHNIGNFRPNVAVHIPRHSTRACRAKNLFNWLINWRHHNIKASSLTPDMNWVVSFLQIPPISYSHIQQVPELNCNSSPHLTGHCQRSLNCLPRVWKLIFTVLVLWSIGVKIIFPYIYHPLQVFSSSLLMKTSCLRLKLVELNFLVSFNTDDQSKTDVTYTVNVTT